MTARRCPRSRRPRRRCRKSRQHTRRPPLPNIGARPEVIDDRSEVGHWEADQVIRWRNQSSLLTLTERVTRYAIGVTMPDGYSTDAKVAGLVDGFDRIPATCSSRSPSTRARSGHGGRRTTNTSPQSRPAQTLLDAALVVQHATSLSHLSWQPPPAICQSTRWRASTHAVSVRHRRGRNMLTLRLHSVASRVTALGPGPAAAIWTQGCGHTCRGCMSPGTWNRSGGALADVTDVADWLESTCLNNLTISGGEPMDQSIALTSLVDQLHSRGRWSVTAYSGYQCDELEADEPAGSRALLERIDTLIDGPYIEQEHAALRWRGSSNQQVHALSARSAAHPDEPAGVAIDIGPRGDLTVIGVPPEPHFMEALLSRMSADGLSLEADRTASFPFPTIEEA